MYESKYEEEKMTEAYNGTEDYVFISYSHSDLEKIERKLQVLK